MSLFKYFFIEGAKYKCTQKVKVSHFGLKEYPENKFVSIDCVTNESGRKIADSLTVAANEDVIDDLIQQLEKVKLKIKDKK